MRAHVTTQYARQKSIKMHRKHTVTIRNVVAFVTAVDSDTMVLKEKTVMVIMTVMIAAIFMTMMMIMMMMIVAVMLIRVRMMILTMIIFVKVTMME